MRQIIAIDSAARIAWISLLEQSSEGQLELLAEYSSAADSETEQHRYQGTENLTRLLAQVYSNTRFDRAAVELICVNSGPGSFTGIRCGLATAQGLSSALDVPIFAVSGLLAGAIGVAAADSVNQLIVSQLVASPRDTYLAAYKLTRLDAFADKPGAALMSPIEFSLFECRPPGVVQNAEIENTVAEIRAQFGDGVDTNISLELSNTSMSAALSTLIGISSQLVEIVCNEPATGGSSVQRRNSFEIIEPLYLKGVNAKTLQERRT